VKTKTLIHEYDKIVVGSSLEALMFAMVNGCCVVYTEPLAPFRFDFVEPSELFDHLKLPNHKKILNTFGNKTEVGIPKRLLWERLLFLLSMDSKIPLAGLCTTIRTRDNSIICSNDYSKIAELRFDKCYYFGDVNAHGLVKQKTLAEIEYLCYDWVAFNSGGKHEIDYIDTEDNDFVNKIWFYQSDRIDGNTPVKDACSVSILTESQLRDFNFSETMARFKIIHEMETRGMKGKFNGYGKTGKPKHYKFRTTSINRTKRQQTNLIESQSEHVEIPQICEKSLLQDLQATCMDSNRFLRWL